MIAKLKRWNEASEAEAIAEILPCNGSYAWACGMAEQRPFVDERALFRAADAVWWALSEVDWQQAFDSHPRIGEQHARTATATSLQWSAGEQSAAGSDGAGELALRGANRAYEERFGRIFLVCATGKSAGDMLAILHARLHNDPETELRESAEQQRRITQLRLRKWLGLPAVRCEDV